MNDQKVNEVLDGVIRSILSYEGSVDPENNAVIVLRPVRCPQDKFPASTYEALEHALWLAQEARTWGSERIEKRFRWLGFIQGVLWMTGTHTIAESKDANRPAEGRQS